jgi:hypothetical protein
MISNSCLQDKPLFISLCLDPKISDFVHPRIATATHTFNFSNNFKLHHFIMTGRGKGGKGKLIIADSCHRC